MPFLQQCVPDSLSTSRWASPFVPGYVHGGAGELLQVYWEECRHHAKEWPLELGEKEFGHFDGQFQTAADHDIAHQGLLSFIRVEGQGI